MNSGKSIKVKRKESILLELLNEAFATLNDSRINSLNIIAVVCSKGASDCKVYLEKSFLTKEEQKESLKLLKKANGLISRYCLESSGWYRIPKFSWTFDELFEKENRIEELFKKIKRE
jgi:ribosome-binding factor A